MLSDSTIIVPWLNPPPLLNPRPRPLPRPLPLPLGLIAMSAGGPLTIPNPAGCWNEQIRQLCTEYISEDHNDTENRKSRGVPLEAFSSSCLPLSWSLLGRASPGLQVLRRPSPPFYWIQHPETSVRRSPPGAKKNREKQQLFLFDLSRIYKRYKHVIWKTRLCLWVCVLTSMTKRLSWLPPVSEVSSYFSPLRFSLSSMTGFFPCLVRMGPCCRALWESEKGGISFFKTE